MQIQKTLQNSQAAGHGSAAPNFAALTQSLAEFTAPGPGKSRHLSLAEAQTLADQLGSAPAADAERFRAVFADMLGSIDMHGAAVDVACDIAGVPAGQYRQARMDSGHDVAGQLVASELVGQRTPSDPNLGRRALQSNTGFSPMGLQLTSHTGTASKAGANGEDLAYVANYRAVPNDSRASKLSNQAFDLDKQGAFDDAVALYQLALNATPDDARIHNRLGLALKHAGDLPGARAAIDQAIALDPKNGPALYNSACVGMNEGDTSRAMGDLARAVAVDPKFFGELAAGDSDFAAVKNETNFNSIVRGRVGANGENLAYVPDILAAESTEANKLRNQALALDKAGKFDLAVQVLDKAIELRPSDPWLHSRRGLALKHAGQTEQAMASLNDALKIDPNFGPALYNKACVLMVQGEPQAALHTLARAVRQDKALFGGHAKGDNDFASIKDDAAFQKLVG